jgi:hypothetical protein
MPIVKQVKGNLVKMFQNGEVMLIANFMDCMGKVPKEIAEAFPEVIEVDKSFPLPTLYRLGDYSVVPTASGSILNFYTQLRGIDTFEFSALKACLKKLSMEAIKAGSYFELAVCLDGINADFIELTKKILNFQEYLLITIVENDKGEVRMGEEQTK